MKAKLTLSIAATLALLLFCVVVTVNSPRSLAGEALGIDLPRPIETQWSDDHGGFLGDGVTRGVMVFSSQNGAALEKALAENEAWHTLPLPEPVQLFVYGADEKCSEDHRRLLLFPGPPARHGHDGTVPGRQFPQRHHRPLRHPENDPLPYSIRLVISSQLPWKQGSFCTFLSYFLLLSLLDGAISNHEQIVKTWEERLDKWSETEYKYLQGNH